MERQQQQQQEEETKLYFAYGSNLSLTQMSERCTDSIFKGIARLSRHRFTITTAGVANIIPSPSSTVFGSVYRIDKADEHMLNLYEGVPHSYTREMMSVAF